MTVTIAVANHKGGVGKTTTTHTLGAHFSEGGYRTLLIDIDPQSSLTNSCGIQDAAGRSLAEVMGGSEPGKLRLRDVIVQISENLDLAPSDIALARTERGLSGRINRERILQKELQPVVDDYDVIFIDCPPSSGYLTINALTATLGVLCPTQPAAQDLRGLSLFFHTLIEVKQELNSALRIIGIVPTFYDERTIHHRGIVKELKEKRYRVLQPIGRSIRVTEAPATAETIFTLEPENPRAAEYRQLGRQVEEWVNAINGSRH